MVMAMDDGETNKSPLAAAAEERIACQRKP
jgi:hypothetical protein